MEMIELNRRKAPIIAFMDKAMRKAQAYTRSRQPDVRRKRTYLKNGRANFLEKELVVEEQIEIGCYDFLEKFLGADFTFIGRGHFAYVYRHIPSGYVVKVTGYNCGGLDTYPLFAEMCMQRSDLKHLPNIIHLQEYEQSYFCIMDELQETPIDYTIRGQMEDIIKTGDTSEASLLVESQMDTCLAIAELAGYACVDLNSSNIMLRTHSDGSNELVITDPFSFVRTTKPTSTQETQLD